MKKQLTENLSYKIVSLSIALILWVSLLNRRDFELKETVKLDVVTSSAFKVVEVKPAEFEVQLSGQRKAIFKLRNSLKIQDLVVDISRRGDGEFEVLIPFEDLKLPTGIRITSVKPDSISVKVEKRNP